MLFSCFYKEFFTLSCHRIISISHNSTISSVMLASL
uniref:Uncharacterized protein n=1 Tax=Anguilla anguilla TaxID=7936 RepID=A0A0E9S5M0_ANGAN